MTPDREFIVEARNLAYAYPHGEADALRDVTFDLRPGTFTAVIGPNGSGKTTLLRLMIGLLRPTVGAIRLFGADPGTDPEFVRRMVGYVPQFESINLRLPVRSRDIVEMGVAARTAGRLDGREIRRRVDEALDLVELRELRDRRYATLSGGQRQRVLIARALAVDPHMLVLDEPFSAMDVVGMRAVAEFLHKLVKETQLTVVAVAHNINTLVHYIDTVLLLNTELVAAGPPAAVLKADVLRRGYGTSVPIIVCEEGFPHPILEDSHA